MTGLLVRPQTSFVLQFIDALRPMADRLHAAAKNLTFGINSLQRGAQMLFNLTSARRRRMLF
jgi:hypothetical protein